jgi:uncharacterized ion transporter superfamily protein YfcC
MCLPDSEEAAQHGSGQATASMEQLAPLAMLVQQISQAQLVVALSNGSLPQCLSNVAGIGL